MKLKFRLLVLMLSLLTLFTVAATPAKPTNNGGMTFEGCWTQWGSVPCYSIYRDSNGVPYICGKCDSSGNPQGGSCKATSNRVLGSGFWCS